MLDTLVVIPACGLDDMTRDLVSGILAEPVDVLVVDNGESYTPVGRECVHRPGRNLGWLGAANYGLTRGFKQDDRDYVCILNNDVMLSWGFFAGLKTAARYCGEHVGLVGPLFNENVRNGQYFDYDPVRYIPYPEAIETRFILGTCLYYTRAGFEAAGLMDEAQQPFGWGTDVEASYLIRKAGLRVLISKWSYLRHQGHATLIAQGIDPRVNERSAWAHLQRVFTMKYGEDWSELLGFDWGIHR
jgi:GT2 family glycosyltransferase